MLDGFPERLKSKRLERGLSVNQIAEATGISYKNYWNIEAGCGRPSLTSYVIICRTLGLELPLIALAPVKVKK